MRFNYDECADLLRHGATWVGIFNDAYGVDISYAMEHYAHILAEAVKNNPTEEISNIIPLKEYLNKIATMIEGI